jgi:uncharacterized membrane protein
MACLALASAAFVGSHFLLSHPLREPLVRRLGAGPFQGLYSLVALLTFIAMIWAYGALGSQMPLWTAGDALWLAASLLMWLGSILFVGSFIRNPALPGARLERGARPSGVFGITRHPMMWGFASWAIVHMLVVATPKALLFDGAILLLALGGSVGQDRKKAKLMGERFHEWSAQTAFVPFTRGVANPGAVALIGGTLLFFAATWAHGAIGAMPAGFWRWIG